ncbi:Helix-hairpin-helix DNA-binding protein [Jannaschia faecimaris]|uniref:Helix-hairpin-helix DNA-binding protein n=1 Tax=Jannaschia faecimaris TaxID=1244108 RepID=A0A1H3S869_9RHOB|nr:helix-hairpin-helix domain-containing protein [Jannaschia faecimaris]SDZ34216.1 Helix-hairpin-helix DNA-binding protein [Jannaschia faecimaris]
MSASLPNDENAFIAQKLREIADLLEAQHAELFRVRAYREAADYVSGYPGSLRDVLANEGRRGLEALPTIGRTIAAAIEELLETGHLSLIDRLRGDVDPMRVFQTVPMIGPKLAENIHDMLDVDTLEALEAAAHDGRLEALPGIGPRRAQAIRHSLAEILARRRPRLAEPVAPAPPVNRVLDVDAEYRRKAAEDVLPKIAPRRFNPSGTAWLPILHTRRGPWRLTALYSNTPNAHRRERTRDWVVVYYERDGMPEGQCTVVTATRGPYAGRRVVRGYEANMRAPTPERGPQQIPKGQIQ